MSNRFLLPLFFFILWRNQQYLSLRYILCYSRESSAVIVTLLLLFGKKRYPTD
jgi:hypothetical protein